ncbi:MAG: DUF2259 domain-containing protein [Treponema sp.]|nr:DUF2259 domain-containing protein [Treponema sp.]
MLLKRLFLALAGLLIVGGPALWAGDSASFVNLGFSADGSVYMFAQYGVRSGTLRPWANLFVVDVARNDFVPGGRASYTHDRPIVAGQSGSGAMHSLIARNAPLAERHGVIFPNQGQPLYIALPGDPALYNRSITFRDFASRDTTVYYEARLVETIEGSGANVRSSFFINLRRTHHGETRTFTVGSPSIWRDGILSYRIRQVLVSPSGDSMIFVIEMRRVAGNTHDIRYMVEALRF